MYSTFATEICIAYVQSMPPVLLVFLRFSFSLRRCCNFGLIHSCTAVTVAVCGQALHWSCWSFLSDGFMLPRCPRRTSPPGAACRPITPETAGPAAAARHRPQLFGVSQYHHSDDHGVTCCRPNAVTAATDAANVATIDVP